MFPLSQSPSAVLKSISDPPNFAAALQMRHQLCVRGDVTNWNMVTWPRNPDNLPEIYMVVSLNICSGSTMDYSGCQTYISCMESCNSDFIKAKENISSRIILVQWSHQHFIFSEVWSLSIEILLGRHERRRGLPARDCAGEDHLPRPGKHSHIVRRSTRFPISRRSWSRPKPSLKVLLRVICHRFAFLFSSADVMLWNAILFFCSWSRPSPTCSTMVPTRQWFASRPECSWRTSCTPTTRAFEPNMSSAGWRCQRTCACTRRTTCWAALAQRASGRPPLPSASSWSPWWSCPSRCGQTFSLPLYRFLNHQILS